MRRRLRVLTIRSTAYLLAGIVLASCAPLWAERNDWAEGTAERYDGATRDYYNRGGMLAWKNFLGDWRDAEGVAQGDQPFAVATLDRGSHGTWAEWDVTSLVQGWADRRWQNQGFFLRCLSGGGPFLFSSREQDDASQRPRLILRDAGGETALSPLADTHLEPSTYRSQGTQEQLRVGGSSHGLLRFALPGKGSNITTAKLRLFVCGVYGSGETKVGVFRCEQGEQVHESKPVLGLAAKYPGDDGIGKDPQVVFSTGFESDQWADQWTYAGERDVIDTVATDDDRKFAPFQGKALRVLIREGKTGALNTLYKFGRETGTEPEEIYFRYYLRLASDWNQTRQGGKMPGISGTYGIAGWGGRKSDGTDGWSARGSFSQTIPAGNPLAGATPIGTYCYHADMQDTYGDIWIWQQGYRGYLENNRWYCVEQYLKLNTPGEKDGVLRAWIDGRPAFDKTDIRFRLVDKLKIEQIWMNVYHGGTLPSPYDQHLFIDNVVVARDYIGPLAE